MIERHRSLLFVPATRIDRVEKAIQSGASAVIVDLEDAISPSLKAQARTDFIKWMRSNEHVKNVGVRINSPRTAFGCEDLSAFFASMIDPAFIMVPKTETAVDIEICQSVLDYDRFIAVVECGRGLQNVFAIAKNSNNGILFGGADFSAELGANLNDWDAMLVARGTIVAACASAKIPAYDVPALDIEDHAGLKESTLKAKQLGFSGRACIHPKQVTKVEACFRPNDEEIARAQGIVEAFNTSNGGVVRYQNKMIDVPVVQAAKRLLANLS